MFKTKNKILAVIAGTIFAIFLPYIGRLKVLGFFYKIFTSIIIVMCIKKYKNIKNFIAYYCLFVAYTFVIGGAIFWLIQLLGIEYSMSGLFMYRFEFPLGLFALILLLIIKLVFKLISIIKYKLKTSNFVYSVVIRDGNNKLQTSALFDSGNNVVFDGEGVNIISIGVFLKLYRDIDLQELLCKKTNCGVLKNFACIEINGIGGGEQYISFVVDCLEVGGVKYPKTRFAVAMKNFGEYQCILHRDFVRC